MAKFYVLCDDDCRYEGMTKEEILTAIEQALEQGYVSDPDSAVFSKIREIRAGGTAQLWVGTEAEFNAIEPAPTVGNSLVRVGADGTLYLCADDNSLVSMAAHLNNKSNPHGVTAEQVGAARADHKHTAAEVGALPTTGGTLTGPLIVANSAFSNGFTLKRSGTNGVGMKFANDNGIIGILGMSADGKLQIFESDGTASYTILDSSAPVTVKQGGTGATNAADALKSLGIFIQADEPTDAPDGSIWIKLAE